MSIVQKHSNQDNSATYQIIAMAASAGGLQVLTMILSNLAADFPAPILIVQHLDPRHRSLMAEILGKRTDLKVKQAQDHDHLHPGCVFIAPPNYHMLVTTENCIALTQTELVHFVRPSADLLFESVAGSYKHNAIAVVLTGTGVDGSMGVQAIHKMGGTVIAQDPEDAEFNGMPLAAIKTKCVDFTLSLEEIPLALSKLVISDQVE